MATGQKWRITYLDVKDVPTSTTPWCTFGFTLVQGASTALRMYLPQPHAGTFAARSGCVLEGMCCQKIWKKMVLQNLSLFSFGNAYSNIQTHIKKSDLEGYG